MARFSCILAAALGVASADDTANLTSNALKALNCDGDFDSLTAGVTCETTWSKLTSGTHQLRATEPAVGYAWVVRQMNKHYTGKKAQKNVEKLVLPVVLGGDDFWLTDSHHHSLAIQLTGDKDLWDVTLQLIVLCDLRKAGDSFWDQMKANNYNLLVNRPSTTPFALPTEVDPSTLPTTWNLEDFGDDMWRSLAGFASHTDDDSTRCYIKQCTYFVDYEWAYAMNYAVEKDSSLWPAGYDPAGFKTMFEALPYRPAAKDVDLDQWGKVGEAVLPLCHSDALEGLPLPPYFADKTLAGWSSLPVPADPSCSPHMCSAAHGSSNVVLL